MITRVEIQNFKAIRTGAVDLTPLHLLIGPNDSGKTSVLEAIAAICRSVDHTAEQAFLGRWEGRELVHSRSPDPEVELSVKLTHDGHRYTYLTRTVFPLCKGARSPGRK